MQENNCLDAHDTEELEDTVPVAAPFAPVEPKYREKIVFYRREWTFLLISLLLGTYPALVFSLRTLSQTDNLPGIGSALFFLAVLAAGVCAVGKRGQWNQENLFVLTAGAICALTLGIWDYFPLRALNHIAAFILIALGLLSASGMNRLPLMSAGMLGENFVNIFAALFSHIFKPFSALSGAVEGKNKSVTGILIGLVLCIPLLALLTALLSSADIQFHDWLSHIGAGLRDVDFGSAIWHLFRVVFFTLVFFSVFYALSHPKTALKHDISVPGLPVSAAVTVLVVLNLLYTVFFLVVVVGSQYAALFDGESTDAFGSGGYAGYARTGFFQLVIVATINLSGVMAFACIHPKNRIRRVLSVLLCAQTTLLLITAVWRMCLYIGAYGLSFLRLLTFCFMAVIGCAIILCIFKDIRPGFKVFPVLAIFALILWMGFSVADTSHIIAAYNVSAYLDGRCETVDVDYLVSLSPSVTPELQRLADAGNRNAAAAIEQMMHMKDRIYNWSLDWLALK